MCGICGIVDYAEPSVDAACVNRMRDAMVNRGPDDCGTETLPHVGLGHRRLSIIDLSPRGRQPMTNENGSIWLVFNGEIYDYLRLRQELVAAGHAFVSDSDSEVLVHGYEHWGIDGLAARIDGMFAFAIWDARTRELHLVRDRLGKKPLYYGTRGDRFFFASELKSIWSAAPGEWKVRPESIARFLYWGYLPGRETIFENVFQLLPARILTLTPTGQRERRYWRLSFADKVRMPASEIIDRTDALLGDAVRRRLRSDVPLGAFLSGGVDSSYVVSRMVAEDNGPVRTFAMGTSDGAHDERDFARRVASHCGTDHTEFEVTADAWGLLPRLVCEFGQPFADPACIPTYYVAARAREHVTVALTGDGGDESFAGYSHHQGQSLGALVQSGVPGVITEQLLRRNSRLLDDGGPGLQASAVRFLRYAHPDPLVRWAGTDHWVLHHLPSLWAAPYADLQGRDTLLQYALDADAEFDGDSSLDRALHDDLNVLLPFCYNVKLDVATMMSSLEARCPFMDREVVEWAAHLPSSVKARPWEKKALLKRVAARRLPREVIYRPKHGFSLPVDGWFRGPWAAAAHDIIFSQQARDRGFFNYPYLEQLWSAHLDGRASHGVRFWSLLWLEMWFRMFVDRTMPLPTGGQPRSTVMQETAAMAVSRS
jgi:asparagine synthase (glutamine-hydrolysing)